MLKSLANLVAAAALAITAGPALAQIQTIDPNQADTYQAPVDPYQAPAEPDAEQPAWDDSGYETPAADDPVESSEWPATDQTDDSAIETSEAPAAASPRGQGLGPRSGVDGGGAYVVFGALQENGEGIGRGLGRPRLAQGREQLVSLRLVDFGRCDCIGGSSLSHAVQCRGS